LHYRRIAAAVLILGFCAMLALNAPGQLTYDSVVQLADGRSGFYDSWHPPVMAFLLGLFDALLPGTLLFLLFQSALLLASLLAILWLRPRSPATVVMALLIVLTPQWLLYQGEIWKDILFSTAALAGFAGLALFAQDGRRIWLTVSGAFLVLAAATRQNGLVLLPVAAVTLGWIARRRSGSGWRYGLTFLLASLTGTAAIALALTARGDGGEGARSQIRVAQVYDLAGALARQPDLALPQLKAGAPKLESLLRQRAPALYTPLYNDPLADDPAISRAITAAPAGAISGQWQALILGHPLLYLHARMAVFGATLLTPDPVRCHFAPVGVDGPPEEMRALGLVPRIRPQDRALADYARHFFHTPVFSHLAWAMLAALLLTFLIRRGETADIAIAGLLTGALLFSASFAVVSIACDYRYLVFLDFAVLAAALHATGRRQTTIF
jgi:hypothetical protein